MTKKSTSTTSTTSTMPKAVHFILQGKGGVGKSFVSAILAQYLGQSGTVNCIDTDPVNQTLTGYSALNTKAINITNPDTKKIDERKFDTLMESLLSEDINFVIDNGSSSFISLSNYLIENNAFDFLKDAGKEVYLHTVITGGQAIDETVTGFRALADQIQTKNIVVWLNEYFGDIEAKHNDKTYKFHEMRAFTDNQEKVKGIINIARRNPDTFGKDIELMANHKLTFNEAISDPMFTLMAKQRIKTVQKDLFNQLDQVGL